MPVFADLLPEPSIWSIDPISFSDLWFGSSMPTMSPFTRCLYWVLMVWWIVCLWKMFKKAWLPGRWSIIPVYNTVLWFKLAWRSWIWALSILFPPLLLIMMIVTYFDIAKKFGKSWWFWVGLWLLNPIFMGILAFWKAEYQK